MRNRKALKCTLGVVVVALFLAVTWSVTAARISVRTTKGSASKTNLGAAASKKLPALRTLAQSSGNATVATNKSNYAPGSTVTVTGSGWAPGETVTLSFAETPEIDGPHVLTTVANNQGRIRTNDFVVDLWDGEVVFKLTATGGSSGLTAITTFKDDNPHNTPCASGDGTGVVTVTANNGSCLDYTAGQNQVDDWEVAGGGSYTMTITGVTECSGDAITVFVQHTQFPGNFCFTATKTADGIYSGTFTMPDCACFTYPLSYKCGADQPCNNSCTFNARGPDSPKVHLRASTFDGTCTRIGTDEDCTCGGGEQGCTIGLPPPDNDLGCNPTTIPGDEQIVMGTCNGVSGQAEYSVENTSDGCSHTRVNTWTITCGDHVCEVHQTLTWKEDTTAPVLHNVPTGGDRGCNPTSLPSCDTGVTATDDCDGPVEVTCTPGAITDVGTCGKSQTFTYSAKDSCNNPVSQDVTYTWKVDNTPPVLSHVPAGGDLGCNPTPPSCDTGVTANDNCDGSVQVTCTPGSVVTTGCMRSQKFTYSASDACGNPVSQDVNYTWKVDTTGPVVSCPSNIPVQLYPGDTCPPTVTFTATANDNCDGSLTPVCTPPSGSTFPLGTTTVTCGATDSCGNPGTCHFYVTVYTSICVKKFYDENRNGLDDDGQVISGWKMQLSGAASATKYTGTDGTVCFTGLLPGNYTVTEVLPGSSWVSTTGTSKTFTGLTCPDSFKFGNYCKVTNGFTIGYWGNNNGKSVLQANDPAWRTLLNSLNLRNANGSSFTVSTVANFNTAYNAFATWLAGANATNMAYMLSAQLAATALDVAYKGLGSTTSIIVPGGVKTLANVCIVPFLSVTQAITCGTPPLLTLTASPGSTSCGCVSNDGTVTIGDLITRAVCLLGTYNNTTASSTARTYEECVKDILDMINNNGNPSGASAYPCGGVINANGACAVVY